MTVLLANRPTGSSVLKIPVFGRQVFRSLVSGILLFFHLPVFTQVLEVPQHTGRFGIKSGWTHLLIGDQHASPLLYQANALNIGAIYQRRSNYLMSLSFTLSIGTNQATGFGKRVATVEGTPDIYGKVPDYQIEVNPFLSLLKGDLNFKMLWELADRHQLGASFNIRHLITGIGAGTSYYTQLDLAPEYQYDHPIGKANFQAALSLPLMAAVVRPNFSKDASLPNVTSYWWGYVKTNTKITSIHRLFHPSARLGLVWQKQNGSDLGIHYTSRWMSYPLPRPIRIWEQSIAMSYFF